MKISKTTLAKKYIIKIYGFSPKHIAKSKTCIYV